MTTLFCDQVIFLWDWCCSVTKSCSTLCDSMDCSMPGSPVFHYLQEFPQTHVLWVVMPSNHLILCDPFSSCTQSFPASRSFPVSQFFVSGGQRIGASASALVLPVNSQDWFPLGFIGLISLLSKGLSRVFSNTEVQMHQFFSTQCSLRSNSHIHTWLLEKP